MDNCKFDLYITDTFEGEVAIAKMGAPPLSLLSIHYIQEELEHYLGSPWLRSPNWLVIGAENTNFIDIKFEGDNQGTVCARCDLIEEAPHFLALLCDLVRFHGLQFFNPITDELILPDLEVVLETIRASQTQK